MGGWQLLVATRQHCGPGAARVSQRKRAGNGPRSSRCCGGWQAVATEQALLLPVEPATGELAVAAASCPLQPPCAWLPLASLLL